MVEIYTIIGVFIGAIFISISLLKLKRQSISQETFTLWMIIGILLIIISSVPDGIFYIQSLLGTEFVLSAVFGIPIVILTLLVFFLHLKVDNLNGNIIKLVAQLGIKEFFESFEPEKKEDDSKNN